ncbi:DinB family protein [Chloroflexota bacterium]
MELAEFITGIFIRISQVLETALDGLTGDEINQQPNPECNSIGWMVWHLTRVQDRFIAMLSNNVQVYIAEKWYEKLNREADPQDIGYEHSSEDLENFKAPDPKTLLDYHHATLEKTKQYTNRISREDLDRIIDESRSPTVALRLTAFISDNLQHVGQIAYLRGWLKSQGRLV